MTETNSEHPESERVPGFVINDMHNRLLHLETNLPPRVQALEMAVSEISTDVRGIREENREARKENQAAIRDFTRALKEEQSAVNHNSDETRRWMQRLSNRITFASGAAWAVAGLVLFALVNWKTVAEFIAQAQAVL